MGRPASEVTEREWQVMQAAWRLGRFDLAAMRAELAASGLPLASTTVATLLRILLDKGLLGVVDPRRPQQYEPIRRRDELARRMLNQFVDRVFEGSQIDAIMSLVSSERLSSRARALLWALREELGDQADWARAGGCLSRSAWSSQVGGWGTLSEGITHDQPEGGDRAGGRERPGRGRTGVR
ncbi:Penicillinase repressor [Isosphaera pallida ATCC 43644]|uniref:Penicillinase repressor n=1 Tax=Isosphaera pallida (strain ATCC 43644 / DSM 9630 / IS1B) TaxID=575540 RepID=E8QZH9_ISOPI|nr:BlaI/MecI/CopY family transcriptional regulator [Isosphaera pallida]ADV61106.1 Penicillinase repressor [Isosphaera pallida ATCC 43644]